MITQKFLNLARAMVEFEGWKYEPAGVKYAAAGSQSWRNHNPGNLRKSPFAIDTIDGFAVFINDDVGFYALIWDIWQKAHGNTSTNLTGESSIYEFIKVYCGESDEVATNYARFIETRAGIPMTDTLNDLLH